MVLTPRIGADFVAWPPAPDDRTLGVVDVFPTDTLAHAERWATEIGGPAYAIDEQTAITVVDGAAEVISEGNRTVFGFGGRPPSTTAVVRRSSVRRRRART